MTLINYNQIVYLLLFWYSKVKKKLIYCKFNLFFKKTFLKILFYCYQLQLFIFLAFHWL